MSQFMRTLLTVLSIKTKGRRDRDRMVVGFTNYLWNQCLSPLMLEFESLPGRGAQHYVIKFVSDLRHVSSFPTGPPVSSTNKTDRHDITEILLKMVLNTIKQTRNDNLLVAKPSDNQFFHILSLFQMGCFSFCKFFFCKGKQLHNQSQTVFL